MAIARKESRYGQGKCKAKCFVDVDFSTSLKQAICEHEGSAGVWIWANLVSLRSVIVHLPWKHVQFCRPKIVFVSLLARCNLLGALGASAGRRRCVFGDVVTTCAHLRCQSLGKATRYRAVPTACCGRCMGRDGLCRIFGGICAPPLDALSEARYIYSSLIGKPRRFEWCPEPAGLRSGQCAMSHTRRSLHRASRSGP